jgi:hypothetical protein
MKANFCCSGRADCLSVSFASSLAARRSGSRSAQLQSALVSELFQLMGVKI